jgi:trans-4-hydroxy-L-proline dehydratase
MAMTERVARLRKQSLDAVPSVSHERAVLLTEFYRSENGLCSEPLRRARAFQYLLEHKSICINPGELIVGEKGPAPKATPTYPELCCHSLSDLDILDTRPKTSFQSGCSCKKRVRRNRDPLLARPHDARLDLL